MFVIITQLKTQKRNRKTLGDFCKPSEHGVVGDEVLLELSCLGNAFDVALLERAVPGDGSDVV